VSIVLLALVGCVEDVAKDKVEAVVEEVKVEKVEKVEQATAGDAWAIDTSRSKLTALGAKITATHPIVFREWEGWAKVADGKLQGVEYTVKMASLEADHPKLTQHLKNEDFFDVPKHPKSTFRSTAVAEGSSEEGMTHTVTGELTIRGTTKQVSFPANVTVSEGEVSAKTEFAIDRKDFGIVYPGKPDDLVQDKVVLTIELVASKPGA
jgi:polyisoprenoid-binding protein YceI